MQTASASIIARQEAVLCGTLWFEECFISLIPPAKSIGQCRKAASCCPSNSYARCGKCACFTQRGALRAEFFGKRYPALPRWYGAMWKR